MNEVNFFVEKIVRGFIVQVNTGSGSTRKVVRKLSEVVTLLKAAMMDETIG